VSVCHLCQRERPERFLVRVEDGRWFCRPSERKCLYLARLRLGTTRWEALSK
jgi:hypothetical protein